MPEKGSTAAARTDQSGGGTPNSSKGEPDPLIGKVINGRFKVVSVIARGGMGKVYKAEQSPLGRLCALKVLSPKYEGDRDPEFHKRFFLEASTAAKLTHANTVTIFDYGQDGEDLYYIAMEYIEGRTLHRTLREEGMEVGEAILTSCRIRLRPVLMTSLATIIGLIPMAMKLGEGSESFAPLARSIVGGLSVSVLFTVFLVPAAYILVHGRRVEARG